MPATSRLTQRLAHHANARNDEIQTRADAAASAVDRLTVQFWAALAKLLSTDSVHLLTIQHHAFALAHNFERDVFRILGRDLAAIAVWSHGHAMDGMKVILPRPAGVHESLREVDNPAFQIVTVGALTGQPKGFAFDVRLKRLRDLWQAILNPPDINIVNAIIFSGGWQDRLASITKLAPPNLVASLVATGIAAGKSRREIAADLLPHVSNVRASAMRTARTEGARVANDMAWYAHEKLGEDVVPGYQIHAVDEGHNPTSRPEHRKRHRTIYWRDPQPGQKGMSEMPHPPREADGTLAFN